MLRLEELRTSRDLTKEALARKAGIGVKTVYRAEHLGTASIRTLRRLAVALEVTVDDLFEEEAVS